jgi:hypothetical protein
MIDAAWAQKAIYFSRQPPVVHDKEALGHGLLSGRICP